MMPMTFFTGGGGVPLSVVGVTSDTSDATNTTSHNIALPALAAGDRAVIFGGSNAIGGTKTWPAGWNELIDTVSSACAYRDCDGSETSPINVTSTGACRFGWQIWKLRGANPASAPEISTIASNAGSANPDPSAVTPSWGSALNLWIAFTSYVAASTSVTAWPTGYSDNQTDIHASGTGNIAACSKFASGSSDNPSAFTISSSQPWEAWTMAIRD